VGPRSAGAAPGPACYGRGGTLPTVSDAYLLLGYLDESVPLAGSLTLRRDLAEQAMAPIAKALAGDATKAAESIIAVATANMLANALPFIARLGLAPGELTLMIFGGAGAIHGPILADEIGIGRVIVPRASSVFCAFGCLVSDLLYDLVRTVHGSAVDPELVVETFKTLALQGERWLGEQVGPGFSVQPSLEYFADVRYKGQSFDVNTRLDEKSARTGDIEAIADSFHQEHHRLYGHAQPGSPIEILGLRLRVRGALARPAAEPVKEEASPRVEPRQRRRVRFDGAWHETAIYKRSELPTGWRGAGPAIIEQETSTVVVPPAFGVAVGRFGDLVLERLVLERKA
jgi:N-methylhydantoinase A